MPITPGPVTISVSLMQHSRITRGGSCCGGGDSHFPVSPFRVQPPGQLGTCFGPPSDPPPPRSFWSCVPPHALKLMTTSADNDNDNILLIRKVSPFFMFYVSCFMFFRILTIHQSITPSQITVQNIFHTGLRSVLACRHYAPRISSAAVRVMRFAKNLIQYIYMSIRRQGRNFGSLG